jgi:hypothetical protein
MDALMTSKNNVEDSKRKYGPDLNSSFEKSILSIKTSFHFSDHKIKYPSGQRRS